MKRSQVPPQPRSSRAGSDLRAQVKSYIDRFGWDVAEDDVAWRLYQRRRMQREYGDDEW